MTVAAEAPQPRPLAQAWAVTQYELRRLLRARHALPRFGVMALPLVMALIVAAVRIAFSERGPSGDMQVFGTTITLATDQTALARLFRLGHLRWIVFLAAAGLFSGLFSGERAERTLHHLFLQPVRRELLTLGKFAAAVLLLWCATFATWILTSATWLAPHGAGAMLGALLSWRGLSDMFAYGLVLLLAAIAYGGVFTLAGALLRSPPIAALGLLGWEALCAFLPVSFQRLTIFYWLDSLLPTRVPAGSLLAVLAEPAPWPLSVIACVAIGAAGVAAAAWRARGMELAYGATE